MSLRSATLPTSGLMRQLRPLSFVSSTSQLSCFLHAAERCGLSQCCSNVPQLSCQTFSSSGDGACDPKHIQGFANPPEATQQYSYVVGYQCHECKVVLAEEVQMKYHCNTYGGCPARKHEKDRETAVLRSGSNVPAVGHAWPQPGH